MKEQPVRRRALLSILGNLVPIVLGVIIALGLVEMLLRAFPNSVPPDVRVNPPVRRSSPLVDESYDIKLSDGDLFYWMQGHVAPLYPDEDQVVSHIHMITDANGFRNSQPEKSTYSIVALGDSFTRASGVASAWPQKLAEHTGSDVLNLGDVGFGPQDELKALREYGLQKQPQWVILAYFEGNDLYDAAAYEQANPFIVTRFVKYILKQSVATLREQDSRSAPAKAAPEYRYPIAVTINDANLEMTFFSSYFSWLTISREVLGSSQNFRLVRETILEARNLSEETGAHFLLVYVPSKEHVYLPYLKDGETLVSVFRDVRGLALDEEGYIQFTNPRTTPDLAQQHMNDQADLLADFAGEENMMYLDLTSTFQEAAGTGMELYYPYDTHWNQLGHDLAAETIYEHINETLPDTENKIP